METENHLRDLLVSESVGNSIGSENHLRSDNAAATIDIGPSADDRTPQEIHQTYEDQGDAGSPPEKDPLAVQAKASLSEATATENSSLHEQANKILEKFTVAPPPRLVFCGRCGIGKSVLISCLLRLPSSVRPKIVTCISSGTDRPQFLEDVHYLHAGVDFQKIDISEESLQEQDIDKFELQTADACIYVYQGELPDAMLDFADLLEKQGTPTFLVRIGKSCCPINDDAFHELELPQESTSMWTPAFQSQLDNLKASVEAGIQENSKRTQVKAVFSGNPEKLAEVRAALCWDYYNGLLATSTGAGSLPAPGVPTLAIMILAATMLFLKTFCLIPSFASGREHAELLHGFARKITPRVSAMGAAFVTADMSKDGLLIVPVAGFFLTALLGGVVSGTAMHILCKDLIPRLQLAAAAFYELDLSRIVDQKSFDEFNELADKVFPLSAGDWQEVDAGQHGGTGEAALPVARDANQSAAEAKRHQSESKSTDGVQSTLASVWHFFGYQSDAAGKSVSYEPFGSETSNERGKESFAKAECRL